ncbi:hypothetical protein Ddye_016894 [Dipteronia dyeriana]|uniref:Uncharacterized protein n=1 Tax=Dipteronia dyeriana TaxID=168575 RepID=A0AAD9U8J2_9ROSI|nr:hypothetical protein Ddye_016894 [Dipteronia dyeriana]
MKCILPVTEIEGDVLSKSPPPCLPPSPLGFGSPLRRTLVLKAVNANKARATRTERTENTSIIAWATPPFTSCAYSAEASASTVSGKEYAHQAKLNFLIAFLNRVGLDTCFHIQNKNQQQFLTF